MHHRDFLSLVLFSVEKSVFGDTQRGMFGDQFNTLHHAWDDRVFDARVFTFGIFTNGHQIDIGIRCFVTWIEPVEHCKSLSMPRGMNHLPTFCTVERWRIDWIVFGEQGSAIDDLCPPLEERERKISIGRGASSGHWRVANGPFSPIRFLVTDSMARRGIRNLPSG